MVKNYRYLLYYIITIGGFSLLMYVIALKGESLGTLNISGSLNGNSISGLQHFRVTTIGNIVNPLPVLLLQIITIIAFARIFGFLCKKIGQPSVIGEIIAGIILGPSLIGLFAPGISSFLFPPESLNTLQFFSQIGLILFMFIVGMDVDFKVLGRRAPEAFVVSHASIIIPFTLGMVLAYYIFTSFAPAGVTFLSFALFIGISLSITAFPVLARILRERGMMKTRHGALAITCAAIDDISAWCLLASLIAIVKAGSFVSSLFTILLSIVYVVFMFLIVRPFLKRLGDIFTSKEGISKAVVAVFLITLLGSAYLTEIIGIHALFGAFIAGLIMPPNIRFRSILIEKIEDITLIVFLPIFFVISGLRTEIGLLNSLWLWKVTGIVILIAIAGKLVGSALSLKFVGQSWRESLIIGALMNTRGLMQLVVLSIGYDLGVISPEIYTIMIIMALVTTVMTGPALDLINKFLPEKAPLAEEGGKPLKFRILISFGNPDNGRIMLRLANCFVRKKPESSVITALHLSPSHDIHKYNIEEYERTSFQPVFKEAGELNLKIEKIFKASQDIERDIIETANSGNFDLLIAGKAHSIYEGSILGKLIQIFVRITNPRRLYRTFKGEEKLFHRSVIDGQTSRLLKSVKIPMGVLIDNGFSDFKTIIIPIYSAGDIFILGIADRLLANCEANALIIDVNNLINQNEDLNNIYDSMLYSYNNRILHSSSSKNYENRDSKSYLFLLSLDGWHKYTQTNSSLQLSTILIIKS